MYFKKLWTAFASAWKLDLRFVFVLIYEILFVLIVTGLLWLFVDVLYRLSLSAKDIPYSAFTTENVAVLQSFYVNSILTFLGLCVSIAIVYVIMQGACWGQVLRKKLTLAFLVRFFLANLAWLLPWTLVLWFFLVAFERGFVAWGMIILAILFTHLTFLYQHHLVSRAATIGASVRYAFSTGIMSAHKFILAYALATVVFIVWSQVWRLLGLQSASTFTAAVLAIAIFAPFLAWLKFYMAHILEKLNA